MVLFQVAGLAKARPMEAAVAETDTGKSTCSPGSFDLLDCASRPSPSPL